MPLIGLERLFTNTRTRRELTFVFRTPIQDGTNTEGFFRDQPYSMKVDATLEEGHNLEAEISTNPVSSGSMITDHIHVTPQQISITAIVTDKPLDIGLSILQTPISGFINATTGALLNPILGGYERHLATAATGLITQQVLDGTNRTKTQQVYWSYLKQRFLEKKPFEIVTDIDNVKNVFFKSLSIDRNWKTGDAFIFKATLQEIQVVRSTVILTGQAPSAHKSQKIGVISGDSGIEANARRVTNNVVNTIKKQRHILSKPVSILRSAKQAASALGKFFF